MYTGYKKRYCKIEYQYFAFDEDNFFFFHASDRNVCIRKYRLTK